MRFEVPLDLVLAAYRRNSPRDIFFMQVGANDGKSGDAIYPLVKKHSLRGVLIEPQHDIFDRLKSNYAAFGSSEFTFVNAAIGAADGNIPFYRIRPGETRGPNWLHMIASFDKGVLMKHADRIPDLESMIKVEDIRCVTFETLFKETGVKHVDLLQIDAEGFDAEVVRLFDVPARKPAIIRFEHKHLSGPDYGNCLNMLANQGYYLTICGQDTIAYNPLY
ncbi:MAG: FkbM family methyltransferase [Silvibacterium sp.]